MHPDNFAFCFQLILDFDRISLRGRGNRGRGRGARRREKIRGDTMWLKALATSTEVQFELEMYLRTQDAEYVSTLH